MKSFSNDIVTKETVDAITNAKHDEFERKFIKVRNAVCGLVALNFIVTLGVVLFVIFHK